MIKRALTASCIAVMAASCTQAAGPWLRGYVVAFYDPAFRYGGRADYSRGTEIEPGVDCPHGSTIHFAVPAQVAKTFALIGSLPTMKPHSPRRSRRSSPNPPR